ncbi:nuclear transport factor 2 family protein [Streptosporangium sp. NBC_01469]|uniref:nuclear transport factor 2 family protein n=1 Tax=Streptosporangium sp. NBC_01469 TaxID=2903898 RepID=UPI002E2A68E7|nr:nuclear transport factor 2 family protein [Streptosporangium sp. NBC_01469]
MTESTVAPGPREIFERLRRHLLENLGGFGSELAEDAVIEVPFAPPGRAKRHEGKEAFLLFSGPEQAAFARRFALDEIRNVVVHETADPEVIVVEYELAGRVLATGRQASSPFIGVLRVRDGKIVNWREYQNTLAMIEIMGQSERA